MTDPPLELREVRYFLAAAEAGSFTAGAQQLGIGQSALSQAIKLLEERLGVALFDRTERRVRLTAAGEEFLTQSHRVLTVAEEAQRAMRAFAGGDRGRLAVGVVQTINAYAMPRIIPALATKHPNVVLDVRELTADGIEESLTRGEIEVGVTFHPVSKPTLQIEPLGREELVLIAPRHHRLMKAGCVTANEAAAMDMVLLNRNFCTRRLVEGAFAAKSMPLRVVAEMNSIEGILGVVRASRLVTILPRLALQTDAGRGLGAVSIRGITLTRRLILLWRRGGYQSPMARFFAEQVRGELQRGATSPKGKSTEHQDEHR